MKLKKPSFKFTLVSGALLILVANGFALASVAYNRSAKESELKLTERELNKTYVDYGYESSGMELNLNWRVPLQNDPSEMNYGTSIPWFGSFANWLDKAKLAELGFDVSMPETNENAARHYERMRAKDVFIVLELDGQARQAALDHMNNQLNRSCGPEDRGEVCKMSPEMKKNRLWQEENTLSRLFAVDAGLDDAVLRARYPDRTKYTIMRGLVKPVVQSQGNRKLVLTGHILGMDVTKINVPHKFIAEIKDITSWNYNLKPGIQANHYEVIVAFGRNHEPWIVSAKKVEK
ncbi:MAG TPA: DUF4824 family protein [Burkholderiales bacterium]|nr:DUF4824 family protein [Burkholderiales bacterium]